MINLLQLAQYRGETSERILFVIIRLAFYSFFFLIRLACSSSHSFASYGATRLMARVVLLFYFVAFHCGQDSVLT